MAAPPTEPTRAVRPGDLPDGFLLGTATSAAQVEGAATRAGRGRSIWDAFAQRPGAIADGSTPTDACDHLARMEDDLDLLAALGVDHYRFSVSWPRIQPTGRGSVLEAGLDVYDRLVDGLLARGIEPNCTLYHWDLPAALEDDLGGWRHRDTAGRFADHALAVAERLVDRVTWWSTLNEPWCSAFLGYERGIHAPGVRDEAGAVRAAHNLLVGHGLATQALRSVGAAQVGIVLNPSDVRPATDREGDHDAAERVDGTRNRYWLGALAGTVPEDVAASFARVVDPEQYMRDGDVELVSQQLDWLGCNVYEPTVAAAGDDPARRPPGPGLDGTVTVPPSGGEPRTMLGWRIDAERTAGVLHQVHAALPDVPLVVSENGIALRDSPDADGRVHDPARVAYLTDHLAAVLDVAAGDVPVVGWFAWSLLDNFEWAEGHEPRFGLIHVDFDRQARTPKTSFAWLRDLARAR